MQSHDVIIEFEWPDRLVIDDAVLSFEYVIADDTAIYSDSSGNEEPIVYSDGEFVNYSEYWG